MEEKQVRYLEMIQSIVTRMASNSFMLKGWSVTLTSALFALAAKDANARYVYIAYFPAIMFWCLDGYFLYQERLFRKLYAYNVENPSLIKLFSMDTRSYEGGEASWACAIISKTLLIFHGVLIAVIAGVMVFLK